MKLDGVTQQVRTSESYQVVYTKLNNGCVLGSGHLPQNWSRTGWIFDATISSLSYARFEWSRKLRLSGPIAVSEYCLRVPRTDSSFMHTVCDGHFNLQCPVSLSDFVTPETSTDVQETTMSQLLGGSLLRIFIQ